MSAMMNEIMTKDKRNMVDEIENRFQNCEEVISEIKEKSKNRDEAMMNKIEKMSDVEGTLFCEVKQN